TGSSLWKGIFAILTKQSNETDAANIIRYDVHHLMKFDSLRSLGFEEKYMKLGSYFVFAVVRHPFERLVSAFNDKLKHPDEFDGNFFQQKHGTRIIQKYRPKASPKEIMSGKPKFSEFIEYLIDPETVKGTINKIDHHWAQYYKIIHPCIHKFDYIVRFEYFKEDTQYILDSLNLSSIVKFSYKDPVTSKDNLKMHMQQLTKNQIYKLYLAYRFDFDLFGYNFDIRNYI
ncbi:carbohydrate sulfotransferase 9-like, partial [Artemia franciscana]